MLPVILLLLTPDTLSVARVAVPPTFDGEASVAEYGPPTLEFPRPAGTAQLWFRHDDRFVYVAARLPDSTFSWRDGLAITIDTRGDRATGPMHDDFQWDFRRVLDSSVVYRGEAGRWRAPRDDPDWRLGVAREGGGWEVRTVPSSEGWTIEFRLDIAYFRETTAATGLALLLFDDEGQDWMAWPADPARKQASAIMDHPPDWVVVLLE